MLAAVALGDGDDQLLADVARKVEVDVRHGSHLPVQETAEREVAGHRVDVREPGQVADDRADRAAPPPPRRQELPRRVAPPYFECAFPRQLEHLPVQEEEAGETELLDQRELALEPCPRLTLQLIVTRAVALGEGCGADLRQLRDRGIGAVGEVRVAVAELLA